MVKVLVPVVAAALAAAAFSSPASARFYVFGSGMWTSVEDSDVSDSGLSGTLESESGWGFAGGVGYIIGPHLRSELEMSYRKNDLDRLTVRGFGLNASGAVSGDATVWAGMLNAIYDVGTWAGFTPYLGLGAGVATIDVDITAGGVSASESDLSFAYQGLAGVRYAVTQAVDVKAGYRYFSLLEPRFGTTSADYHSHNFELGVAFKF